MTDQRPGQLVVSQVLATALLELTTAVREINQHDDPSVIGDRTLDVERLVTNLLDELGPATAPVVDETRTEREWRNRESVKMSAHSKYGETDEQLVARVALAISRAVPHLTMAERRDAARIAIEEIRR